MNDEKELNSENKNTNQEETTKKTTIESLEKKATSESSNMQNDLETAVDKKQNKLVDSEEKVLKTNEKNKIEKKIDDKETEEKAKIKNLKVQVDAKKEDLTKSAKEKPKLNKDKNSDSSQKKQQKPSSNNKSNKQSQSDENEYIEKLVSINRVAKVVKGGRRFSFAALVVVGDGNGMVGHGKGKAKEVPEAIKKATDEAKVNLIRVPLRQARTLHHDITGRYDAGKVHLRSAPSGTGVIAGGPMRAVFEALGIKDIVAKSVGSSNPHNMIRATFNALSSASSPKLISIRRGLKVNEITKRRKVSQNSQEVAQDG